MPCAWRQQKETFWILYHYSIKLVGYSNLLRRSSDFDKSSDLSKFEQVFVDMKVEIGIRAMAGDVIDAHECAAAEPEEEIAVDAGWIATKSNEES